MCQGKKGQLIHVYAKKTSIRFSYKKNNTQTLTYTCTYERMQAHATPISVSARLGQQILRLTMSS